MNRPLRHSAFAVAILLSAAAVPAQAQSNPYALRQSRAYAVEVAPNTYVIRRPIFAEAYPYTNCANCGRRGIVSANEPATPRVNRRHKRSHRAMIERKRAAGSLQLDGKPHVIHAEAEITILGPDRMSIRLFRKGAGGEAKAEGKK